MATKFIAVWREHPIPFAVHPIHEGEELTLYDIGVVRLTKDREGFLDLSFTYVNRKHGHRIPYKVDPYSCTWHRVSTEEEPVIGIFDSEDAAHIACYNTIIEQFAADLGVEPTEDAIGDALLEQSLTWLEAENAQNHPWWDDPRITDSDRDLFFIGWDTYNDWD